MSQEEDKQFERDVARVARMLWSNKPGGAAIIDGRERDGIYETEECVHCIECTTSRQRDKAVTDIKKLDQVEPILRHKHPSKGIKTWFITKNEPTADQRSVSSISKSKVSILSFNQFQSKLIDIEEYLTRRNDHFFGSLEDNLESVSGKEFKYVEVPILSDDEVDWNIDRISRTLLEGNRITMLGDFGIGKSTTLREVFRRLRKDYFKGRISVLPLHLNLREHHGQTDPSEILERHGRIIGYHTPYHLVRAWRSGGTILLLDGFDEIASLGLLGAWQKLREARFKVMTGVRKLLSETPESCGIAVAGRHSFFDSDKERGSSLGDKEFVKLILQEFTHEQIETFLGRYGVTQGIPNWLPARPLLLSTILSIALKRGGAAKLELPEDPSTGWNLLLHEISSREAKIEAGVSGETIRRLLEMMATKARTSAGGLGPITALDVSAAYGLITGSPPTSEALSVLQRLPGLAVVPNTDNEQRSFIDEDIVNAYGAADVREALCNPYELLPDKDISKVVRTLSDVGLGILFKELDAVGLDEVRVMQTFAQLERVSCTQGIFGDLFLYSKYKGYLKGRALRIESVDFQDMEIRKEDSGLEATVIKDCLFNCLSIASDYPRHSLPIFAGCLIENIEGYISHNDLPAAFEKCEFETFLDRAESNSAVLRLDLPAQIMVLVTILRKLFVQSLSGRKLSALKRGLEVDKQRYIDPILEALFRENFATKYTSHHEEVILPVRRMRPRAMAIIKSPLGAQDPLVKRLALL